MIETTHTETARPKSRLPQFSSM